MDGQAPRWVEIAGCGMVDPNVFEAVDRELGLDPGAQARYTGLTGFAFGIGLDRLAMQLTGAASLRDVLAFPKVQNMTELSFLYQGRVSVQLGTANNLDYKIRFAAYIILDTGGDGLASSDRGTLDVSDQQTDGTIQSRFLPAENSVATPEPTPEPPAEDTTDAAADAAADGADLTADAPQDDTQSQE